MPPSKFLSSHNYHSHARSLTLNHFIRIRNQYRFVGILSNLFSSRLSFASMSTQCPSSTSDSNPSQHNRVDDTKRILFLRHGQATHNPRAEAARSQGCSYETFLDLMKQDDAFDADLTPLGEEQAIRGRNKYQHKLLGVQLIVSSPLTRTLKTADLTICPHNGLNSGDGNVQYTHPDRICVENFREINGLLENAKRHNRSQLQKKFHSRWDFDTAISSEADNMWTDTLESQSDCAERGYQGILWLIQRKEHKVLVVTHGGILRFLMVDHPNVKVIESRKEEEKRFENCELREYEMSWTSNDTINERNDDTSLPYRPIITLTEV